ncbi:MAG: hypothetical protein EXR98_15905 [Gemmataceae bacterium]|nr:hypothetical protein [Gemmataceae bacterium]
MANARRSSYLLDAKSNVACALRQKLVDAKRQYRKDWTKRPVSSLFSKLVVKASPYAVVSGHERLDFPAWVSVMGLGHIAKAAGLCALELSRTDLTDAGIEKQGTLSRLRFLELRCTMLTETGLQAIQKKLPTLKITK